MAINNREELEKEEFRKKIEELHSIYDEFVQKLNVLRNEQNVIIQAITKRIEDKKIKQALEKLKKL